ncbi:MAG TPA: hypothetical protein VNC18_09205 [Gemmatimonadaceae bacterium]|jgi:hypothetical protein|nr:hypothetical protein [Gemmatimonadaceae bacterium]
MADSKPPRPGAPGGSFQRRVIAAFTQHLLLKGTAVFLAVVLWFVVNAKEPQVMIVPVRFNPVLDSSLVLREALPPLQAIIAGSPKELIKLSTDPPIVRRQITANSPDTLVLDLRPADVTLPDGVDAVVRDVEPHSVTLRFESTWTRKVPVRSMIDIAEPLPGPIATQLQPDSVMVTGPRQLVMRIPSVRTVKMTVSLPDSLPHLVDIDTVGFGSRIRIKPGQVKALFVPLPHI